MRAPFSSLLLAVCLVGCTQVHDASLGSNASSQGGDGASSGDAGSGNSHDGDGNDGDGDDSNDDSNGSSHDGSSDDSSSSGDQTSDVHDAGVDASTGEPSDHEAGEWWEK